jgi:protein disulfide-isomerase A1
MLDCEAVCARLIRSSIIPFALRSERPTLSVLDKSNLKKFKTVDDTVFIAYLRSKDVALKSSFAALACRNQGRFSFGIVSDATITDDEDITFGCIVRYQPGEERISICENSRVDILQEFVEKSTVPLIGEMTRRNELKYLQVRSSSLIVCTHFLHSFFYNLFLLLTADRHAKAGKSLVYIFALTERERDGYRSTFTAVAKKYQEYLNFVIIDAVEYASMAPAVGLEAGVFPALAVQNPMLGQVFPFDQKRTITPDAAETFVLDIVQGKTKPAGSDGGGIVHDDL